MKKIVIKTPEEIGMRPSGILLTTQLAKQLQQVVEGDLAYVFRGEWGPAQGYVVYKVINPPKSIKPVKLPSVTLARLLPADLASNSRSLDLDDLSLEELTKSTSAWDCKVFELISAPVRGAIAKSVPDVLIGLQSQLEKKRVWRKPETHNFVWDSRARAFHSIAEFIRLVDWEQLEAGLAVRLQEDEHTFRLLDGFLQREGFEHLNSISGRHFESLCRNLIERMGFVVELTQASHDEGVDLVAQDVSSLRPQEKYIFSCKRYSRSVPIGHVRELDSLVGHFGARRGVLLTNATASREAKGYARDKPITIVEGPELRQLLQRHGVGAPPPRLTE